MSNADTNSGSKTSSVCRNNPNTLMQGLGKLYVRINIDPNDAVYRDDKFRLFSTDRSYTQTKTIRDDLVKGDEYVDLLFTGLSRSLKYSLEVYPGKEGTPFLLFQDVSYDQLSALSPDAEEPVFQEDETVEPSEPEGDAPWFDSSTGTLIIT